MTLKIYTFSGTDEDKWLEDIMNKGQSSERIFLHGMLTYDYFSIIKTVRSKSGNWSHGTNWKTVDFPFAFVVFGKTDIVPWDED